MRPTYIVPALDRGLAVLEFLSRDGKPATVSEITRQMRLPRASVFRILSTLQTRGFVEVDASGKAYQIGPGVLRLGYQYVSTRDVVRVGQSEVERLAQRTGVSAHLAVRDGTEIVYVLHALGNSNFVSNLAVGDRLPAHATPTGQLLLSQLSREEISSLYKKGPLETLTDQTPRSRRALMDVLGRAAKRSFVVSHGAVHPGGKSIAAPIFDASGKIIAAIDISGPDQAFEGRNIDNGLLPEVLKTASTISQRLGYSQDLSRLRR
jgi:DNA-binding IclR family transcriptional regulator